MNAIIINLFDCLQFNGSVFKKLGFKIGECSIHTFPDGESLVRYNMEIANKDILIVADLAFPAV